MMQDIEYTKLIRKFLSDLEKIQFEKTDSTATLSIRILSGAIIALCRDAFSLLEQNRVFSTCSLVCQVTEAQIQLLCVDKLYDTKAKDYYEFAFVEQLKSLEMNPDWKERTLKRMAQYNCERFYNGRNSDTLNIKNYHKHWHSSFANTIKELANIAFPHFKELLSSQHIHFIDEFDINLLYENYQTLCSFKHLSPFIVGDTFLVQNKLVEKAKNNHKGVALTGIYWALVSVILILVRHRIQIPSLNC